MRLFPPPPPHSSLSLSPSLKPFLSCSHAHIASGGLSAEQQQFQQLALEFAKQELAPHMKQWDEDVSCTIRKFIVYVIFMGSSGQQVKLRCIYVHVPVYIAVELYDIM